MRVLRNVLTALSATSLLLVLGPAAPASAADSTVCPQSGSTRLLTANDGEYKLWVYQPSSGEVDVCFGEDGDVRGVFVFKTGLSGSLVPSVSWTLADPTCPDWFHLQDPADVLVKLGDSIRNPYSVCFGVGTSPVVRVTVGTPTGTVNPDVDLWLDPYSYLWYQYCTVFQSNSACYYGSPIRVI